MRQVLCCGSYTVRQVLWCGSYTVRQVLWCRLYTVRQVFKCGWYTVRHVLWCGSYTVRQVLWCGSYTVRQVLWCGSYTVRSERNLVLFNLYNIVVDQAVHPCSLISTCYLLFWQHDIFICKIQNLMILCVPSHCSWASRFAWQVQ